VNESMLFAREQEILERCEDMLANHAAFVDDEAGRAFGELLASYRRLVRRSCHLIRIGDRQEKALRELVRRVQQGHAVTFTHCCDRH